MNKSIISIVVGLAALGGLIWLARPAPTSELSEDTDNSGSLTAETAQYDFGAVSMAAGNVSHQFKVRNAGNAPLTIKKIYTSCMCTTARLKLGDKPLGPFGMPGHGAIPAINQTIAPQQEAIVETIFDPAAHGSAGVGRIQRTVILENSAGQPLELEFSANVTP